MKRLITILVLALPFAANAALIEVWQSEGDVLSLADADSLIASGDATFSTFYDGLIDFDDLGDGTTGFSDLNVPWPGDINSNFAARITGSIDVVDLAIGNLWVNHDDGVRLDLNGSGCIFRDGIADNRLSGCVYVLSPGSNLVEITFFEHLGGASLELFRDGFTADNLIGLRTVSVPEPGTLVLFGIGLAGMGLARRKRKI